MSLSGYYNTSYQQTSTLYKTFWLFAYGVTLQYHRPWTIQNPIIDVQIRGGHNFGKQSTLDDQDVTKWHGPHMWNVERGWEKLERARFEDQVVNRAACLLRSLLWISG